MLSAITNIACFLARPLLNLIAKRHEQVERDWSDSDERLVAVLDDFHSASIARGVQHNHGA